MQLREKLTTLRRLHQLIQQKATGNSIQLAQRLHVSKSTLFRYINELKEFGAPIAYSNEGKHYYYEQEFELHFFK